MQDNHNHETNGIWEKRFCITPWCDTRELYVQRKEEGLDIWRVTETPNQPEWLMASVEPVCPCCGGHLLTQANLDDGVDELAA